MNRRLLGAVAACTLLLAACGDPGSQPDDLDAPDAVLLSYSLQAGDRYDYQVDLDQHIDLTTTGDATAIAEEYVPSSASVDIAGTATFSREVSAGPEDGTYEVHITGSFDDLSVTGTVDGEPVDASKAPDFASMEPIDVTVVVDEQGNVIDDGGQEIPEPLAGIMGGIGGLGGGPTSAAPGFDAGTFFGPLLDEQEVTVGDTWSDEIETPGAGEDPITTSVTSTVTGVEDLDGVQTFVIDTDTSTARIEVDLGELFKGMFGAFMGDVSDEEQAEFDEMMSQLRFLMAVDDAATEGTSWFDPEAGLMRKADVSAGATVTMDVNMPDESDRLVSMGMEMSIDQDVSYRLLSGPAA